MENPVENEAKQRIRRTGKAYDLDAKIRRGEGTDWEARLSNLLHRRYRHPGIFPSNLDKCFPTVEGSLSFLLWNGYLEIYQNKWADLLESEAPHLVGKEEGEDTFSELDEFEILEKGKSLQDKRSHWEELTPEEERISDYLDKVEKDEDMPFWALKGLVRDGFIEKKDRDLDEEYEVESL